MMRGFRLPPCAVGVLGAAAIFASCSGGAPQSSIGATGLGTTGLTRALMMHRGRGLSAAVQSMNPQPDHDRSWVSPDVKPLHRVLFESDFVRGTVSLYKMPELRIEGVITGFDGPQGECADASGNIWVAVTRAAQIVKLSRAGSILSTLSDPTGYPIGCAVNPSNGDLAVTNIFNPSLGPGDVLVYPGASGNPTSLSNSAQALYYFAGYDGNGNLMVNGFDTSGNFILSECPAGSSGCSTVTLSGGTVYYPGMVQWSSVNQSWVVGDQLCGNTLTSCLYWYTVSGSAGTITGSTALDNYDGSPVCDVVQAVVAAYGQRYIAAGNIDSCFRRTSSVDRWASPAGGLPTNSNERHGRLGQPTGAAISTK
jgi:hypothetical protein